MSAQPSYYPDPEGAWNDPSDDPEDVNPDLYVRCPVCKGTGIDPASRKSHQDDEWDCMECHGDGDIPVLN